MKTIIYTCGALGHLMILIPKKTGNGYLKQPFGGAHANDAYRAFQRSHPAWFLNITGSDDSDGYIEIATKINSWDADFERGVSETMAALIAVFPHVEAWEKNTILFFNTLTNHPARGK
jgi:hypothetical protein